MTNLIVIWSVSHFIMLFYIFSECARGKIWSPSPPRLVSSFRPGFFTCDLENMIQLSEPWFFIHEVKAWCYMPPKVSLALRRSNPVRRVISLVCQIFICSFTSVCCKVSLVEIEQPNHKSSSFHISNWVLRIELVVRTGHWLVRAWLFFKFALQWLRTCVLGSALNPIPSHSMFDFGRVIFLLFSSLLCELGAALESASWC